MLKKGTVLTLAICLLGGTIHAAEYQVVDGDSLELDTKRIRLDGIDAPEFMQNCYDSDGNEYPCGLEAVKYLENLVKARHINCDCLPEPDIYNREMCECFADDISLNRAMVYAGYAITYRSEKYIKAEKEAKKSKRGIWQGKFMRPALFRALERTRKKNQETLSE